MYGRRASASTCDFTILRLCCIGARNNRFLRLSRLDHLTLIALLVCAMVHQDVRPVRMRAAINRGETLPREWNRGAS